MNLSMTNIFRRMRPQGVPLASFPPQLFINSVFLRSRNSKQDYNQIIDWSRHKIKGRDNIQNNQYNQHSLKQIVHDIHLLMGLEIMGSCSLKQIGDIFVCSFYLTLFYEIDCPNFRTQNHRFCHRFCVKLNATYSLP